MGAGSCQQQWSLKGQGKGYVADKEAEKGKQQRQAYIADTQSYSSGMFGAMGQVVRWVQSEKQNEEQERQGKTKRMPAACDAGCSQHEHRWVNGISAN